MIQFKHFAKQLIPFVDRIDTKIKSDTKTTRANLMAYGLELFAPNFTINAGPDRLNIIESVQEELRK